MARSPRPTATRSTGSPSAAATPRKGSSAAAPAAPRKGSTVAGGGAGRRGGLRARAQRFVAGVKQLRDVYQMTRRVDPAVTWWMLGGFAVFVVIGVVIGALIGHLAYVTFLGVVAGVLAAMFLLARRAERAAYTQMEGQPGAAGAALRVLRRGWTVSEEPVAIDARTKDTVFRAVGRPGVVLVSDGPAHRVGRMLDAERRRVLRVLPDVPVHTYQAGRDEGQIRLGRLPRTVMRLRPTLTRQEVTEVTKRLRALGGLRPPIPKGIDPTRARPDRKAARGR